MKNNIQKPNFTLETKRADLEKRLFEINAQLAALTPDRFKMPDDLPNRMRDRLKQNQLLAPDTEVLRQLLLEKAEIAEKIERTEFTQGLAKSVKDKNTAAKNAKLR